MFKYLIIFIHYKQIYKYISNKINDKHYNLLKYFVINIL